MKISVITPSFNQAQFLPFNLASVRSQSWQDIEHIIVDPGSTDGSTEIARRATGVTLVNEPDRGQSHGISKGFARSSGDVLVWLNSDDLYPDDGVIEAVAQSFEANPDVDIVYGNVNFVDRHGAFLRKGFVNDITETLLESFEYQVGIVQPGVFLRRRTFEEIGGPSEEFEYCMDYEYWVRLASAGFRWKHLPRILAHHRWWEGMKTSSRRDLSLVEHFKVCARHFGYVHWKWLDRFADYLCTKQDGVVHLASSVPTEAKATALRLTIDKFVTQEMLRNLEQSSNPKMVATLQYVHHHRPERRRIYFTEDELEIISEHADDPKSKERVAWNTFDASASDGNHYLAYHVPNNFHRYFRRSWHQAQLERTRHAIDRLSYARRGDVCVIVGNGPSLCKSDLSLLENVDTIISNFAQISEDLRRHGDILTVVNDMVAMQGSIDFNASPITKIVPFWLGNYFNENDRTFFTNATVRPAFGQNFSNSASWRSTVSFYNMQLAYALGYRTALLIGFDHSYVQPQNVVEGALIRQQDDDENHFDPRYFKGKDWQAADTVNMGKVYLVAKAAYEAAGREIVNCTVGGSLEVFRRGDLAAELDSAMQQVVSAAEPSIRKANSAHPKLLMIDSTPLDHLSATGQLKKVLLGRWPANRFLQVSHDGGTAPLRTLTIGETGAQRLNHHEDVDAVLTSCRAFDPDVIYFRPIDSWPLLAFAERAVAALGKPLVLHMMDDWPERLREADPTRFALFDASLRRLISASVERLSIGEAMSNEYERRYGYSFVPLGNGVDTRPAPIRFTRHN